MVMAITEPLAATLEAGTGRRRTGALYIEPGGGRERTLSRLTRRQSQLWTWAASGDHLGLSLPLQQPLKELGSFFHG